MSQDLTSKLIDAVQAGDGATCRRLLERGAKAADNQSLALAWAADHGQIDICRLLIEHGARADDDRSRALALAAEKGRIDVCRLLIEIGARADDDRSRALAWAAEEGHIDICRLLIEHGARADDDRSRALALAAEEGHIDICRLLIEHGADVSTLPPDAKNTLIRYAAPSQMDICTMLYPERDLEMHLDAAEKMGNTDLAAAFARNRGSDRLARRSMLR